MNETKTTSMLQRIPVVLAVTAASYGLQLPAQAQRWSAAPEVRPVSVPAAASVPTPIPVSSECSA